MDHKMEVWVRSGYAKVAESGLSTDTAGVRAVAEAFGYSAAELAVIPTEANLGLCCGNPTALAGLRRGEVVVDLGSGGGMDVFLAAAKVGPSGRVIGIDMTAEMITLARRNAGRAGVANVEFHLARIDQLPLCDESVDCVISNCVINLVPDKRAVLREVCRVLRPGGRVAITDIAIKRPLPDELASNLLAYVGCIAGAISAEEYRLGLAAAGFGDIAVIDTGADLNAYAQVADQCCCSSPSMAGHHSALAGDITCNSSSELHAELGRLLARYDINHYAASVRVYAIKVAIQ